MLRSRPLSSLILLAVLAAGVATPGRAQDPRDRAPESRPGQPMAAELRREPPQRMDRQRSQDALSDSVRHFERARGDRVLSAERMQSDGRDVNRIKAMDSRGRVRVYVDDPSQQRGAPRGGPRTRGDDD